METDNFTTKIFPQNGLKLESVENKIRDIFIQCLVFNKTILKSTHACWIWAYNSQLGALHLVRYLKAHIQRAFME